MLVRLTTMVDKSADNQERNGRRLNRRVLLRRITAIFGASGAALAVGVSVNPEQSHTSRKKSPRPVPQGASASSQNVGPLEPVAHLKAFPQRTAFAPEEQQVAPFLLAVASLGNDVDDSSSTRRGFIKRDWWRKPYEPYNARVNEQVHTLAWFYCTNRPWNPYYRDEALGARMTATIRYLLTLQNEDGSWPESAPSQRSRAATGFVVEALALTLKLLHDNDLGNSVIPQLNSALRRAAMWFLDPGNDIIWQQPATRGSNQVLIGLSGIAHYLAVKPDPWLRRRLDERLQYAAKYLQASAGFFNDPLGSDFFYNFAVSLTAIASMQKALGRPVLVDNVKRYADWLGLICLPEPDGSGSPIYGAASARTRGYFLSSCPPDGSALYGGSSLARSVPALRPFYGAAEDLAAAREYWANSERPIEAVQPGEATTRTLLNLQIGEWSPTRAEKAESTDALAVLAEESFVEDRSGPDGQRYVFVRRPHYYVAALFGRRATDRVSAGPGMLWNPDGGTFIQAGNDTASAWTTIDLDGNADADQNLSLDRRAAMTANESATLSELAWRSTVSKVRTVARLADGSLTLMIRGERLDLHQIPLIIHDTDRLSWAEGAALQIEESSGGVSIRKSSRGLDIVRNRVLFRLRWRSPRMTTVEDAERKNLGDLRLLMIRIEIGGGETISATFGSASS